MKILIHGKNLELTGTLKEYTEAKIEKATHHYKDIVKEADIHLSIERTQESRSKLQKLLFLQMVLSLELKKKLKIYTQALI